MPYVALQSLIDDTIRRNEGWTDVSVAARGTTPERKLTPSDISYYRRHGMRTLVPAKVRALALGLRLPAYRVAVAVLSDLGIDVPLEVRTPEEAITHDHTLSARTRDALLALIELDRSGAR